jgi:hypothetical protein
VPIEESTAIAGEAVAPRLGELVHRRDDCSSGKIVGHSPPARRHDLEARSQLSALDLRQGGSHAKGDVRGRIIVLVTLSLALGLARSASAQSETFTFVCETASGAQTFGNLAKPNSNSATFTDRTTILVSAIGANVTGGTPQSNAVLCTVNGEGPFAFFIVQ